MKSFCIRAFLAATLAGIVLYLIESQKTEYGTDWLDVVDSIVDAGMEEQVDLGDPDFLKRRTIISTTDVNAAFSKSVIGQLLALDQDDSALPIDLYLRTEGGWEADAYAVIDTIRSLRSPVNVHAMGEVHSAGAMILAAGTGNRIVYEHTVLGFHAVGPDEEPPFDTRYIEFWKTHAQLPAEWLDRRDEEMTYFSAEEALEMGVADEIFKPLVR